MTDSNANTSGLVEKLLERARVSTDPLLAMYASQASKQLVAAASAQARIAELEAENDVLKVEVIGLRAAIFGSHDYDPALRHGNFIEMARATEDGRQGALARANAAEARADRLADIVKLLDECIWFNPDTQNFEVNHDGSVEKARAALQQETQK